MESLLTENEVSAHFKVSLACLRRWRLCGEGPQYVKVATFLRRWLALSVRTLGSRTRSIA